MCYSKEVTFTVGTIMTVGCIYMWQRYVRPQTNSTLKAVYSNLIIGYFCVALHQYLESFAVGLNSAAIYKVGLIASISCMFFYMRSLEKLSNLKFGSSVIALIIILFAIPVYFTALKFENFHFWVRGKEDSTYLLWSSLWMAFFIYWNVCIFYFRQLNPSLINKKLLVYYSLFSITISFLLYICYGYFSLFIQTLPQGDILRLDIFTSFDMVLDSPSIWCVFSMVQVFLMPCLLSMMDKNYDTNIKLPITKITSSIYLQLIGLSAFIWLFIIKMLPMFFAVAYKMVTG